MAAARIDVQLIRRIHDSPLRMVLALTGGGASVVGRLLAVPGASRTMLEALVPYSAPALDDLLGAAPEQYCSERTGRAMAMVAFERARRWQATAGLSVGSPVTASANSPNATADGVEMEPDRELIIAGIGCTASLASDRPKRGSHRAHLGVQTADYTLVRTLHLERDARDRAGEEDLLTEVLIRTLADVAGVERFLPPELRPADSLDENRIDARPAWRELLLGSRSWVGWNGERTGETPRAIFPGAFNPLHDGHREMARLAAEQLKAPVAFELSIENVDKPPLDYVEIDRRGRDVAAAGSLLLTRAPTFLEKARLFPNATFLVGADTLVRIADPKYYGRSESTCAAALDELARLGSRFLVFGRRCGDRFLTLDELPVPATLRALCQGVSGDKFRADVSSTELRQAR